MVTITDDLGIAEKRGFDPFGKPREGDWSEKTPPTLNSTITERGFTDHEHLDESELIHMNGRVYDYNLGRFLSVDPIIQAPGNSQSMNPYSYIMNNPLSGTDPSGYMSGAVIEECQAKPASCRAVAEAESGGMNSGLIGNFGMPGYRGQLLAGSNGASVGAAPGSRMGRVIVGNATPDQIGSLQDRGSSNTGDGGKKQIQQQAVEKLSDSQLVNGADRIFNIRGGTPDNRTSVYKILDAMLGTEEGKRSYKYWRSRISQEQTIDIDLDCTGCEPHYLAYVRRNTSGPFEAFLPTSVRSYYIDVIGRRQPLTLEHLIAHEIFGHGFRGYSMRQHDNVVSLL